jgi:exopolyphosphatase/pppGpp-phosphohydrolase
VGVIVPGLAILGGALDALGADRVMVSERDILDGIAMESVASRGARAE